MMRLLIACILSLWAALASAETPVVPCVPTLTASGAPAGCATVITPIVSTAGEVSHIVKTTAGNLISVFFANTTGNAGFVMVLNTTTVPTNGTAVVPLDCAAVSANGNATINYSPGPPSSYSVGIVVVASASGGGCSTYTTASQPSGFFSVRAE